MSKLAKIFTVGAMVLTISATGVTAFAATSDTESDSTEATCPRFSSMTQAERLELKKDRLEAKVEAGQLTQDEADAIIEAIEENQANCDGSGTERIGQKMGAKFGSEGRGQGHGENGQYRGNGQNRLASCVNE